jgi:TolB protein
MRLSSTIAVVSAALSFIAGERALGAEPPKGPAQAAGEDLLGELVVEAGQRAIRPLPKIGVVPSLSSSLEDVTLRSVVRRDLELCGEFELLPESSAPEGLYLTDSPVDVAAWASKGAEAVIKVSARRAPTAEVDLVAQVYLKGAKAGAPAFERRLRVPAAAVREESHRAADLVIGALTGTNGGFASRMTFILGRGSDRRVYTIDADGHDATAASPAGMTALSPAFGPGGELFYAAAGSRGDPYAVYSAKRGRIAIPAIGSVYGLAFANDGAKVALSAGMGSNVGVVAGPDFNHHSPASSVPLAVHPAFSPGGELAFAGEGPYGQRIYMNGRPISPAGLFASSPVVCDHPSGVRVIFAATYGRDTRLVATGERGGPVARLTSGNGSDSAPACSPDGRLVAFFSTRTTGEGPGLYVMRLAGGRSKRISPLVGDSLRWGPLSRTPSSQK